MKTVIAALIAAIALPAVAATPIPNGRWSFVFKDARGRVDRPMRVYTYRPKECDTKCPIVFVMHGVKRDASTYRDYWELAADKYKVLVVAPEFNKDLWQKSAGYNQGDVASQPDREKWGFAAIEHIFDEVRDGQASYVLFGHSAGGQFAHRFAIFRPDNRASVIVAANPGWYTMPEWRKDKQAVPFPYSLVNAPVGEAELRQALSKRLVLMLGEKDVDPDDENLSQTEGAKKQGDNRLDRGENFFKAATAAANDLGVKLAWDLVELPDVAHDGQAMSRLAADSLFGRK